MPQWSRRAFELAANIHPADSTGDRQLLLRHLGNLYIRILLPDRPPPISNTSSVHMPSSFVQNRHIDNLSRVGLATGALVISLAEGRYSEDTDFSEHFPTGRGLLCFKIWKRLIAGVAEIDRNYPEHMRAARELAEEYLNSQKSLPAMLSACGC